MVKKVSFTAMEHGTQEDFDRVMSFHGSEETGLADRVLGWLREIDGESPYQISRFEHCLQTATRAERDGADEETIVCALLHDVGDALAPANHAHASATLLQPYVSEKNHWIVLHHGIFQGYYYFHYCGQDRNARDKFRDHPYYQDCVDFCANWDQVSFDPDYDTLPLEHFEPMLRRLFARPAQPMY